MIHRTTKFQQGWLVKVPSLDLVGTCPPPPPSTLQRLFFITTGTCHRRTRHSRRFFLLDWPGMWGSSQPFPKGKQFLEEMEIENVKDTGKQREKHERIHYIMTQLKKWRHDQCSQFQRRFAPSPVVIKSKGESQNVTRSHAHIGIIQVVGPFT